MRTRYTFRRSHAQRNHSRRGFTVLEVLISLAILAVGFSGVLTLLATGTASHRTTVNNTSASILAASVLSDVEAFFDPARNERNFSRWSDKDGNGVPDQLENRAGTPGQRPIPPMGFPRLMGFDYDVQYFYPNSLGPTEFDVSNRSVLVRVRVYWENSGDRKSEDFYKVIFLPWDQS